MKFMAVGAVAERRHEFSPGRSLIAGKHAVNRAEKIERVGIFRRFVYEFLRFGFGLRDVVAECFIHTGLDRIALFGLCASCIEALLRVESGLQTAGFVEMLHPDQDGQIQVAGRMPRQPITKFGEFLPRRGVIEILERFIPSATDFNQFRRQRGRNSLR